MRIRDDELYKFDGFKTWTDYLKLRVGDAFGIEKSQAYKLITSAQLHSKIQSASSTAVDEKLSEKAILEFARLAPKNDDHDQRRDVSRILSGDVKRVLNKAQEEAKKRPDGKVTASVVRKIVDQDLGIDRAAMAKETKRVQEEARAELEQRRADLRAYLADTAGTNQGTLKAITCLTDDQWRLFRKENQYVIDEAIKWSQELADFLRKANELPAAGGSF